MVDTGSLRAEQHAIWDRIAPFWAEHSELNAAVAARTYWIPSGPPAMALKAGARVLELGCGRGARTRALAMAGCRVLATDVSPTFLAIATDVCADLSERVSFQVLDATDADSLAAVDGPFDAVVADMVLMNLATLGPLAGALPSLLTPGGYFAATLLHPCFPSGWVVDSDDRGRPLGLIGRGIEFGRVISRRLPERLVLAVSRVLAPFVMARPRPYLESTVRKVGVVGQPESHFNFHRPLGELLAPFFRAGLVLDDLRESSEEGLTRPGVLALRFRRST